MVDFVLANCPIEYAKIFDAEGQYGDVDRGKADSEKRWLRDLAKNPKASINVYFPDEESRDRLLNHSQFNNDVTNPQTGAVSQRIKKGNEELGIGWYIQVQRKINNVVEYVDRKTKEIKEVDFGGFPKVSVITYEDGKPVSTPYNYAELGAPSNGSVANIKLDLHNGNVRLEAVAFTELKKYEPQGQEGGAVDGVMF